MKKKKTFNFIKIFLIYITTQLLIGKVKLTSCAIGSCLIDSNCISLSNNAHLKALNSGQADQKCQCIDTIKAIDTKVVGNPCIDLSTSTEYYFYKDHIGGIAIEICSVDVNNNLLCYHDNLVCISRGSNFSSDNLFGDVPCKCSETNKCIDSSNTCITTPLNEFHSKYEGGLCISSCDGNRCIENIVCIDIFLDFIGKNSAISNLNQCIECLDNNIPKCLDNNKYCRTTSDTMFSNQNKSCQCRLSTMCMDFNTNLKCLAKVASNDSGNGLCTYKCIEASQCYNVKTTQCVAISTSIFQNPDGTCGFCTSGYCLNTSSNLCEAISTTNFRTNNQNCLICNTAGNFCYNSEEEACVPTSSYVEKQTAVGSEYLCEFKCYDFECYNTTTNNCVETTPLLNKNSIDTTCVVCPNNSPYCYDAIYSNSSVYYYCITYIELITMTNTVPYDYHDIVISWKKGSEPTAETQPSKFKACVPDVTNTSYTGVNLIESPSSSIYKSYVPRPSGITTQSTIKAHTVFWDITPQCLPNGTIRVAAKMMYFSCSAGSRIFYDQVLVNTSTVTNYTSKMVIDHPNSNFLAINSDVKINPVGFTLSTDKTNIRDFVRYNSSDSGGILNTCVGS